MTSSEIKDLEKKLYDLLEESYDTGSKAHAKELLYELKLNLMLYQELTGKKHQIHYNIVNLYVNLTTLW